LGDHPRRLLETGGVGDTYGDPELMSVIDSAYQAGWTFEQTFNALENSPLEAALLRAAGRNDPRDHALKLWFRSIDWTFKHPAITSVADLRPQLLAALDKVQQAAWPGSLSTTRKALLVAIFTLCLDINSLTFSASERQLTEASGRATRRPIRRALRWLRQQGVLVLVAKSSSPMEGTRYRLALSLINKSPVVTSAGHAGGEEAKGSGVLLTHDAFARGGGLGLNAARIFEVLAYNPMPVVSLSVATGLSRQTTMRNLSRLETRSLATRRDDGWVRGPADVDAVAARRGSSGSGLALEARHDEERLLHRGWMADEDGHVRLVCKADASLRVTPRGCLAMRRDGQWCQAKAMKGTDICRAHRDSHFDPCPQDLEWAAEFDADAAHGYEFVGT
jgi:hypothetical protein